jgi:hypothetical protein
MKKLFLNLLFLVTVASWASAQGNILLTENEPSLQDGMEVGYSILNEQTRTSRKEEVGRFEVTVYMTNRSGCPKIVLNNENIGRVFGSGVTDPAIFAIFDCLNATGRRLTSRNAQLRAPQFFIPYQVRDTNAEGRSITRTENAQAGFILRNGETISTTFIVIVPDGERPRMQCRITAFSTL